MRTLLTVKQVCERIPISRNSVYKLVRQGKLAHTRSSGDRKRGSKILIPEEALEALFACTTTPQPPKPTEPTTIPVSDAFLDYYAEVMARVEAKAAREKARAEARAEAEAAGRPIPKRKGQR